MAFVFEDELPSQAQSRYVFEPEEPKRGVLDRLATSVKSDLSRAGRNISRAVPAVIEGGRNLAVTSISAPPIEDQIGQADFSPIVRGIKAIPGAALDIVKHGVAALRKAPQFLSEVPADEPRLSNATRIARRLYETPGELLRGFGETASAGLTREFGITPPPKTEGAEALRTLGGFASFPAILKRIPGGAPGKVAAGAAMGAAVPVVRGEGEQALEGAVTGAGLMAGFELAGAAFRRYKGRNPVSRAEVVQTMREEPAFIEVLKEERARRTTGEEPAFIETLKEDLQATAEKSPEKPRFVFEEPKVESQVAVKSVEQQQAQAASQKARPKMDDSEVAVSTFIARQGGLTIPKELKEEFGGWSRLNKKGGLAPDEMAVEAHNAGLIPEPTTNALLEGLKSGKKSSRISEGGLVRQEVEAAAESKIRDLTETPSDLEYKGKTYHNATREGNNVRLRDDTDVVLKKAEQILSVEEKVAPVIQQTEAGAQTIIPGAETRTVPSGPLRPRRAQTETPMDLEQFGIRAKEPGLFGQQKKPVPVPRERLSPDEIAAQDEMRGMLGGRRSAKPPDEAPFDIPPAGAEMEPGSYGFPEFRKTPKDVPQSVTPMERNYQPPTRKGPLPIVRRGDIIRDMQDAFQVPIRTGHGNFAQMKAAGFFKVKEEVIRLKQANDMEAVAHEVGHFISKKILNYEYSKGKGRRQPFHGELEQMGKDLYGSRKPHGGYAEEGIAEFIRYYVVDPAKAQTKAPKFFKFFEEAIGPKHPDVIDTLHAARDNWRRYQEQPAVARVLSQISIGEKDTRPITLDGLYKHAIDDIYPIKVFTERMSQGKAPLDASDNPYVLARLFRGWIGKADLFLKDGPIDFDTLRPVGGATSLNKILAPFSKNLDDLRAYLVARRAAELMTRGKETGLAAKDVQATLEAYNGRPEFVKAAEMLQSYNNALLDYLQKSGVLSAESVARIKELNQDYVPFYRLIEGERTGGGAAGTQRFANLGSPIKRLKGSAREIIDPLESIVKNTYAMINVAERNQVGRALVRLAENGEGMGKFIEKVPRDKIPVTLKDIELQNVLRRYGRIKETESFQTSKQELTREIGASGETPASGGRAQQLVEAKVMEALRARGFADGESKQYIARLKSAKSEAAVNSIIEKIVTEKTIRTVTKELELDLPPELVAAFRPDPKVPGMDNILSVRTNGKPELYQAHPDLYNAMLNLDQGSQNILIKLLSLPARALRLGATTLSPEFAVRNPLRDQWTAAMYSKYGGINIPGGDLIRGLFHVIKRDALYQAWKAGGGVGSSLVSLDRRNLQKTLNDVIRSGQAKGIASTIVRHPIESLRMFSELGESVTRVGEFAKVIQKEGGFSKENILRAGFESREITLDFARMGSAMKVSGANQIVAFLNANIQAQDKMIRAFRERPALMTARGVATITVPSLLLYMANKDDPRYQELPRWQKDLFWIIPSGTMTTATWGKMTPEEKTSFNREHTIWRIPKPFELGVLFGTLPERVWDWIEKNDPQAMADFAKSAFGSFPNPIPTATVPLIENMANWSIFRERPIVSRGKEFVTPSEQYGPYTSETAKKAGKLLDYSPAKIENLIQGYTGGTGRSVLSMTDLLAGFGKKSEPPEKTLADVPVLRAFVARSPAASSQSIERFFKRLQEAETIRNTFLSLKKERRIDELRGYATEHKEDLKEYPKLRAVANLLAKVRKKAGAVRENDDITPAEKRDNLDALNFRMIDIARRGLNRENQQVLQDLGLQ